MTLEELQIKLSDINNLVVTFQTLVALEKYYYYEFYILAGL